MWKLTNTKKEHWDHFILVGEDCVVGRKDAPLMITGDPSVSRKHAVLSVKHSEENLGNPSRKSSLFLRDEGSKYGTFKNGSKITGEEQLSDGDTVKFGQFESEFRVHYIPLIVTSSCLDVASKNKLKRSIHKLGGHIVPEWQPTCTHLVMSSVKVTVKALCCLVSLKPIVLPDYFEELEVKLKSSATIVLPKEFIPPIGESLIDKDAVSFDVIPLRKNIFKNKAFFFLDNKQFKKLHLGIIMGGGNASILCEGKDDLNMLLHENSCFIEPIKGEIKEESKGFLREIINVLQRKNLRMIPESDIGLAVAYASTEKFCNPLFNVGSAVMGSQKIESQTLTEREVYAPDTEERVERSKRPPSSFLLNTDSKSKKPRLDVVDSFTLTTSKAEDVEDVFEIPLSAEIKQELDDLFDITSKGGKENGREEEEEIEEIGSTLPIKREVKGNSAKHRLTEDIPKQKLSPKKPKIEQNTSFVNGNGFTSFDMNGEDETNLPRNLISVKFVSLIVKKPVVSAEQQNIHSNVKNFKKFKKVLPLKSQALPRIIGGNDLVAYDRDASKLANDWDDEVEVSSHQPVKGAFDWDNTPND